MKEDFKFNTIEELYNRVLPALRSKVIEFKRQNINYINETDIWKFLADKNWKTKQDLAFCELVDSIMNLSLYDMDSYLVNKTSFIEEKTINVDDSIL